MEDIEKAINGLENLIYNIRSENEQSIYVKGHLIDILKQLKSGWNKINTSPWDD